MCSYLAFTFATMNSNGSPQNVVITKCCYRLLATLLTNFIDFMELDIWTKDHELIIEMRSEKIEIMRRSHKTNLHTSV